MSSADKTACGKDIADRQQNQRLSELGVSEDDFVDVYIRGKRFSVFTKNLCRAPESRLYKVIQSMDWAKEDHVLHYDASVPVFGAILDYYICGDLHLPSSLCGRLIKKELDFWGIGEESVTACCLAQLEKADETLHHVKMVHNDWRTSDAIEEELHMHEGEVLTFKQKIDKFLNHPKATLASNRFYRLNLFIRMMYVIVVGLKISMPFRVLVDPNVPIYDNTPVIEKIALTKPPLLLINIEFVCCYFCFIIWLLRMWVSPSCRAFFKDPGNLAEVFSFPQNLIGSPVVWVFGTFMVGTGLVKTIMQAVGVLQSARLINLFVELRHHRGIRMMLLALGQSRRQLSFLFIILAVASLVMGYALYLIEMSSTSTDVRSAVDALWWGIITMTTVGYGDIIPSTVLGKFLVFICVLTGLMLVSLPVPVISANFYNIYEHVQIADLSNRLKVEKKRASAQGRAL